MLGVAGFACWPPKEKVPGALAPPDVFDADPKRLGVGVEDDAAPKRLWGCAALEAAPRKPPVFDAAGVVDEPNKLGAAPEEVVDPNGFDDDADVVAPLVDPNSPPLGADEPLAPPNRLLPEEVFEPNRLEPPPPAAEPPNGKLPCLGGSAMVIKLQGHARVKWNVICLTVTCRSARQTREVLNRKLWGRRKKLALSAALARE